MRENFLKDSEFFPYKTIMSFSDNYEILSESDNSYKKIPSRNINFIARKTKNSSLITCDPVGAVKAYQVWFLWRHSDIERVCLQIFG